MVETGKRAYRSPLREEQARVTRRTVVEAARDLFLEVGYAGATIDAVAARAGVSRKTVFTSVGGKAVLLKIAWDWTLAGDDEPVPIEARPAVQQMIAEPDPDKVVTAWTRFQAEIAGRLSALEPVLLAAADLDPDAREIADRSEQDRVRGASYFVQNLAGKGGLSPRLTVAQATVVAATLMDPMPYRRLVRDAGWSFDEYVAWLERLVRVSLVDA